MNDDLTPRDDLTPGDDAPTRDGAASDAIVDDDIVSAVLDGEATAAERALVEGSARGRRRLEELRMAAAAVNDPVSPLEPAMADALVARALAAGATTGVPVVEPASADAGEVQPDELRARRDRQGRQDQRRRSPVGRRLGTIVAAVAAAVVLVAGVSALAQNIGRSSSSDSATSGGATAATADQNAESADSAAGAESWAGMAPPDLGPLEDAEVVVDRFVVLRATLPEIDHQFDDGVESSAPSTTGAASDSGAGAPTASDSTCPVPPVPVAPGEDWSVRATARLPGGPVLVMGTGTADAETRLLVVDATTCAVLAERTI